MQGIVPPRCIPSAPVHGLNPKEARCRSYRRYQNSPEGLDDVFRADRPTFRRATALASRKDVTSAQSSKLQARRSIPRIYTGKKPRTLQSDTVVTRDLADPSSLLKMYNRLLREERLNDCLDLLELMEERGVLDMNKVYHARFLKLCKSQRAVAEALRFTKLIKQPSLSTFNMLLSVCASSQDSDGAYQVLLLVKEAGLRPDCYLYTTLIATCGKSGKVDAMFEVFHEMVNAGVEPNIHTYGALIDGCARAGQVAKAFGAYGIMSSKKVKPDRVIFNALINACGQSGAVDRAFDVLAEMTAEPTPMIPDHVTIGALMRTCANSQQASRAREVYKMLQKYNIKGDAEVYTIAVSTCCKTGDLNFALSVYDDMTRNGVLPDEMFLSTLINVAGHAGEVDVAFDILTNVRNRGIQPGAMSYSSLMGACCNAKNWKKALELHEFIMANEILPTVSTLNALVTSLCDGGELQKAVEVFNELREAGVCPNVITYSILIVACEKKDEIELGFQLLSQAKTDGVRPNLIMCRCLTGLCLRRFQKACLLGEPVVSLTSGKPQIDSTWTTWAIMTYRETIAAGVTPTIEVFCQVLGCLQFPRELSWRSRFVETLDHITDAPKPSKLVSLLDGFGEYDSRSFSILEEASSLGVVPCLTFKEGPLLVDARKLQIHTVEVYVLTVLKTLRHRLAAGAKLPNVTILLATEKTKVISIHGEKTVAVAGRIGQAVGSLLRRLGLQYQGDEAYGKIRISGLALKRWMQPKTSAESSAAVGWKPPLLSTSQSRLGKGIFEQQRSIRSSNNLSLGF
ncbi:pentatricopeptide repeat (PPR) superfamily protein isoform X2 [Wolffia australiana]